MSVQIIILVTQLKGLKSDKMAYVYILGLRDGTHYCGIARKIVKRILDHQKGRSKSTREKRPIVIKYITEKSTMIEARQLEVRIKKQGVTRWWTKNKYSTENLVLTVTDDTRAEYIVRKIEGKENNSQQPTANNIRHTNII